MAKAKPKILVIGTGGTISAIKDGEKLKYGEVPQDRIIDSIPQIRDHYDIKATHLFRMDSSDLKPEHWLTLANTIYYNMQNYDGIVVTMGTDTLHYAATAIAFLIQNNNIPIVFTGAKTEPFALNSDARTNLRHAIIVAGSSNIAETLVVFNSKILRATRATKVNASEFGAFDSYDTEILGRIEQYIKLNEPYKKRGKRKPALHTKLEQEVATIKVYPGFDGGRIKLLIDDGAAGIVIEGYGLGNLPLLDNGLKEGIKYAEKKNIPIALTSDCFLGSYWKEIYPLEIGKRLKGMRVIHCYDMLTETAYVKMMWAMAITKKYPEIKKMMQTNYAGEITPYKSR
ncbi:MAG: asparaginase [archaeon]|nr:asparaginase [archaeon]